MKPYGPGRYVVPRPLIFRHFHHTRCSANCLITNARKSVRGARRGCVEIAYFHPSKKPRKPSNIFAKKPCILKIPVIYSKSLRIRRRGGKLLSYQVISTENCPRRTGAKGSPVFSGCACKQKTHGWVYAERVLDRKVYAGEGVKRLCAEYGYRPLYENSEIGTKSKKRRNTNERTSENQNQA